MTTTLDELVPIRDLQHALDKVVAAGAPGILARVHSATNTSELTSGVADRGTGAPMTSDMHFRAGSNTKTFVATVVLQLVGEGRLKLDDPVAKWLPWFRLLPQANTITVRQILNHTGGLYDYTTDPAFMLAALTGKKFRPEELVLIAALHPLTFPPGTGWAYSNTDYIVAGLVVEKVTGESIGEQLRKRLFQPLGLAHTSFPTTAQMPKPHARGYHFITGLAYLDVTETFHPSAWWAAGGIVSNAADLATFFQALLAGKLLSPELLEAMKKTTPTDAEGQFGYGLGLIRLTTPYGTVWGHGGRTPGYNNFPTYVHPDGTGSAVIMANALDAPSPVQKALEEAAIAAIGQMLGQPVPTRAATDELAHFLPPVDDWSGLSDIIRQTHTAMLNLDLPVVTKPS